MTMFRQDRLLLFLTLALASIGLLALFVAVRGELPAGIHNPDFLRQALWMTTGIAVMALVSRIPFSAISGSSYVLYAIGIAVLALTLAVAPPIRGSRSWVILGPVRVQPSELLKPIVALALARFVADRRIASHPMLGIIGAIVLGAIPAGLIMAQPDFGTALTYGSLILAIPYVAGLPTRFMAYGFAACLSFGGRIIFGVAQREFSLIPTAAGLLVTEPRAGAAIFGAVGLMILILYFVKRKRRASASSRRMPFSSAWIIGLVISFIAYMASFAAEGLLKPYQQKRILAFISPGADPHGASYNVLQSMIAVGSGGFFGRGIGGASQTALGFLPERQTDFIFSAICETFGFFGAILVVLLFALLLVRISTIGARSASRAGALFAGGIASLLAFHVLVNAGMALGLVPVMGIPLPLLSYGGSSMLSTFLSLGIIQSIAVERRTAMLGTGGSP